MIHYDERYDESIRALRWALADGRYDLLVRNLKLQGLYFQEPGFIFYGHSIDSSLERIDEQYSLPVRLFSMNSSVPKEDLSRHFLSEKYVDQLTALGLLVEQDGLIRTDSYVIVPYLGTYLIASMGTVRSIGAYLGRQSYILAQTLFTHPYDSFLDLGSGCGVLGILAAKRAGRVVGIDIMEEATEVARTNAVLNAVERVAQFYLGDMYEPVRGMQFDAIVANAPFVALPKKYSDLVVISSGEDGLGFLRRLIEGIFEHRPKIARMIANGLGNETEPLLSALLKNYDLPARGYRAKLLVFSKGLLDENFILGTVKIVEGAYSDRGLDITRDEILSDLKSLYKSLGVTHYYGIILEIEESTGREAGKNSVEIIDISNRYSLNMSPVFRDAVKVEQESIWSLKLDQSSLPLDASQKRLLESINKPLPPGGENTSTIDFYCQLERIFGAKT